MTNKTCDYCCGELEFKDNEYAKYNFSDDEEIVDIYICTKCGQEVTIRKRDE